MAHIPPSFGMLPPESEEWAFYIPSNYGDPLIEVIERLGGETVIRPELDLYF